MFRATRMLAMQPTRMALMQRSPQLFMRQTMRMMEPVPKEPQSAHTISQRLRRLKEVPAELWPLFVVVGVAVVAAFYSLGRKLVVDKTLRLQRNAGRD